jgi:uncharacterized protein (TIGR02284 family)
MCDLCDWRGDERNRHRLFHITLNEVNQMSFHETPILKVIEVLHDGERGYASLGEHLQEPTLKSYFMQESAKRARFATELETVLSTATGKEINVDGVTYGTMHRVWGEAQGSDETLLATAEQSDDAAKQVFTEALQVNGLPPLIRAILVERRSHIRKSHAQVKSFREAVAA